MVIDRLRLRRGQHLLQLLPAGGADGRKRAEAAQELIAALLPDAGDGVELRAAHMAAAQGALIGNGEAVCLLLDLADQGMAVTFISSEVEEMLRTCSRMAVLRDGEKVGELEESELSQSNIMKAIAGGDDKNE